ncbi:lactonase family protein [Paenibacillus sp. Marseille-Q4541]|uniref:lactonase family protein n=1 Tax=Paenibacillus sp. Marseille-Q4541 TaxID=2831522 RepID=UPI002018B3BE|nr:lactonase family protein [Paenibacillus sp. Marseille-Q4541]
MNEQLQKADEVLFYTGTYSTAEEPGIFLIAASKESGEMRIVNQMNGIGQPSFVALHPNGEKLYAVSEKGEGELFTYQIDASTKELHLLDRKSTEGADPCYVSVDTEGRYVLVANYSSGSVSVYKLDESGLPVEMSAKIQHVGEGFRKDRQEGPHAHSILPSSDGHFVFVCDLGLDQLIVYRNEDGKLSTHYELKLPAGSGPRHLVIHPSEKFAYIVGELNSTVTALTYNKNRGEFQITHHISTREKAAQDENTGADIRVSPCGRFLYVSNRGDDTIALFHINEETGALTAEERVSTGGKTPRNFNLLEGGLLLAANQGTNNLVSFRIDSETGRLTQTGFELELTAPVCIEPFK